MVTTQLVSGNIGSKVRQAVKKANDTYLAEINTTHFSPSAYNANQKAMLALNFVLKFSQVVVYGGKGYTWGWEHWPRTFNTITEINGSDKRVPAIEAFEAAATAYQTGSVKLGATLNRAYKALQTALQMGPEGDGCGDPLELTTYKGKGYAIGESGDEKSPRVFVEIVSF